MVSFRRILFYFLLGLVALGAMYIYVVLTTPAVAAPSMVELHPEVNITILESGVVDRGVRGARSMYILYRAEAQDVSNVTTFARAFWEEIPTDIYLLDYRCVECDGLGAFKDSLESKLKLYSQIPEGSSLTKIKINQLERLDKPIILVVPTGRLPAPLIDPQSEANINRLMERGSVVIYIGSDFSQALSLEGTIVPTDPATVSSFRLLYTPKEVPGAAPPYRLERGEFTMTGPNITAVYNSIFVVKYPRGYFVVIPNSIDAGWFHSGPEAAGEDVALMIHRADWDLPFAWGESVLNAESNGTLPSTRDTIFMEPSEANGGWVRLTTVAALPNGTYVYSFQDLNITNPVTGRLSNPDFSVNNTLIDLDIGFRENFPEPREFDTYISVWQNGEEVDRQELGVVNFQTIFDTTRKYRINLGGGDHILRVVDRTGRIYAQSFLHIPEVVAVLQKPIDWEKPAFKFQLLSDGRPVPDTKLNISIDDGPPQELTTDAAGFFIFRPEITVGYGMHAFTINATGRTMSVSAERVRAETFFDKPQNQVIIVATILVGVLAVALRTTEKPKYFIDVPDFPPQVKERIPLSRFAFINLIDSMNREYRWRFMPLSLSEIKAGVRKRITYQGKPILISDYNLEKILQEMIEKGDLSSALGLYGIKAWENQAKKDMHYLAAFRLLRNFCINNALLFTDVGVREDCDMMVSYRGENLYLHIYKDDETVRKALASARKGRNFIIFEDADALREFRARLAESATPLAVLLKMELDARAIVLTHLDALGVIIGRAA